jgi:hypothetical protein
MLAAVEFDNQGSLKADKVADVPANRSLPSKFESIQLATAQTAPKKAFSLGGVVPEFARSHSLAH